MINKKYVDMENDEKYNLYKLGFDLIDRFIEEGNTIGAYLLAFSILEDRVYTMWYRRKHHETGWTMEDDEMGRDGLYRCANYLKQYEDFDGAMVILLRNTSGERNGLVHKSLWNLNGFTPRNVRRIVLVIREIDKFADKQKKLFKTLPKYSKQHHIENRIAYAKGSMRYFQRLAEEEQDSIKKLVRKTGKIWNEKDMV